MDTGERQQPDNQANKHRQHPYQRTARPASGANPNETILNSILEKASNIERATNASMIRTAIKEALKEQCRNEREVRLKTLTFNSNNSQTTDSITDAIMAWVTMSMSGPPSIRPAKEQVFVQMASIKDKEALVDFIKISGQETLLSQHLIKPLPNGLYFERLPVKLEINNLPDSITIDKVRDSIMSTIQHNSKAKLIQIKDGKTHAKTKKRTISMRVNGEAFLLLIIQMNAIIPLNNGKSRVNLFLRINCRPWQCGNCHAVGHHPSCLGRLCTYCGSNGHQARECERRTKFCRTCGKLGHRAKDNHCPRFLSEVAKEIGKHDFPIEVLADSEMLGALLKQIQLN